MLMDAPKRLRIGQDGVHTQTLKIHLICSERSLLFAIATAFLRVRLTAHPLTSRDDARILEDKTHRRKLKRRPEESLQSVRLAASGVAGRVRDGCILYRDLARLSALRRV